MTTAPNHGHGKSLFWRRIQGQLIIVLLVALVPSPLVQVHVVNEWYQTRRANVLQAKSSSGPRSAKMFESFVLSRRLAP